MTGGATDIKQPITPETLSTRSGSERWWTLINFPWQIWVSLITLFLIFVGIGAAYFWIVRLPESQLASWVPAFMTTVWISAGMGVLGLFFWNYHTLSRVQRQRMNRQEHFIEQKKHHLQVLYDVASAINRSDNLEDLLQRFLTMLSNVVETKAVAIHLLGSDGALRLAASVGLDDETIERGTTDYGADSATIGTPFFSNDNNTRMLAIPLQYRDKSLGLYNLFVSDDHATDLEEEYELLFSIGQHLGMAIEKANMDEEAQTLSIIEERTRMAHELHDSLAQTLASLRFKVRLFDDSLNRGDETTIWEELESIETTVDDAYAELRSLITDFRAPIDGKGVVRAVKNLSERFKKDTELDVFFYHNWSLADLSPEAELEVIRIVQEALNNVKKHSQANTVRILMYSSEEGRCSLLVEDDGIGLPDNIPAPDPITGEHIGISVMQERTAKLNGELQYESDPDEGGTLMQLSFDVPQKPRFSEPPAKTTKQHST